jgi:hypothetical protein
MEARRTPKKRAVDLANHLGSRSPWQVLSDLVAVNVFRIMAWYAVFRLLALSDQIQVVQMQGILIAPALSPRPLPFDNHQVLPLGTAISFG